MCRGGVFASKFILPHEIDFCWESPNSYTIQRVREDDILPYEKIKDDHVGETFCRRAGACSCRDDGPKRTDRAKRDILSGEIINNLT